MADLRTAFFLVCVFVYLFIYYCYLVIFGLLLLLPSRFYFGREGCRGDELGFSVEC